MELKPDAGTSAIAKLAWRDQEYHVCQKRVTIGRHSSRGAVDVDLGISNYISRAHLELFCDGFNFFLKCNGKNGAFVDDHFLRHSESPMRLPAKCLIRFPSDGMKLRFFSLLAAPSKAQWEPQRARDQQGSPALSPAVTLSASSSRPASPRPAAPASDGACGDTGTPSLLLHHNYSYSSSDRDGGGGGGVSPDQKVSTKPPFSYAQLIAQSIASTKDKQITLSGVYAFITKNYPYFRTADKGWQNSIRHNLSLSRHFVKVPRVEGGPGKGCFWRLEEMAESRLLEQAFRSRRKNNSASPYGESAPAAVPQHREPATDDPAEGGQHAEHVDDVATSVTDVTLVSCDDVFVVSSNSNGREKIYSAEAVEGGRDVDSGAPAL